MVVSTFFISIQHSLILGGSTVQKGERTYHLSGACESHSHIRTACPFNDDVTAVRVPFSRVHGFWLIQRHSFGKMSFSNNDTMFMGPSENEIVADTHGLIKVYLGNKKAFLTSMEVKKGLDTFESINPNETILTKLR